MDIISTLAQRNGGSFSFCSPFNLTVAMRYRHMTRLLLATGLLASLTQAFVVFPPKPCHQMTVMTTLAQRRGDDADESVTEESSGSSSSLPLLPHFGMSSQSTFNPFDGTLPDLKPHQEGDDAQVRKYVANRKFELQYTCNVCDTRNRHKVSRIAYRKGVVIATCKGCGSQHLIADNLGFTNLWNEEEGGNIEEYFAGKGMEDSVNRVSKDVFDLEKVLGHDSDSGAIVGDDGKPAME